MSASSRSRARVGAFPFFSRRKLPFKQRKTFQKEKERERERPLTQEFFLFDIDRMIDRGGEKSK